MICCGHALVPCETCSRLVVDGSMSWFGAKGEFVLRPVQGGVDVFVGGEMVAVVTADELRHFLRRAYGKAEK